MPKQPPDRPRRGKCLSDPRLRERLKAHMKKARLTGPDLAALLQLSRNSFYNKLEGSSPFTLGEVALLSLALQLSPEETCALFLSFTPDEERRLRLKIGHLRAPGAPHPAS